jgi:MSHA biogenesis protein MshP
MMARRQTGFSLVTAIFLLVAVAGLVASMVNLSSVQHSTVAMSVRGARAMEAARSAMDYAIFQVLKAGGGCAAATNFTFTAAEPELQPYSVQIDCTVTQHTESTAPPFNVFTLTVTASAGSYASGANANPDFVSRQLRATVSQVPP